MHTMSCVGIYAAATTTIDPNTTIPLLPAGGADPIKQLNSLIHDESLAKNCSSQYQNMLNVGAQQWYLYVLDFVQGTVCLCYYVSIV